MAQAAANKKVAKKNSFFVRVILPLELKIVTGSNGCGSG
jgi:hypothetical protein